MKDVVKEHPLIALLLAVMVLFVVNQILIEVERLVTMAFEYALLLIGGGLVTGGGVYALARARHPEHLNAWLDKKTGRAQQNDHSDFVRKVDDYLGNLRQNPHIRRHMNDPKKYGKQ